MGEEPLIPELLFRVDCESGETCPAAYILDGQRVLMQGDVEQIPGVKLGPGEGLLSLPAEVILEAARALGNR